MTLGASRDNTLYEDEQESLSNGAGQYLFAGSNNIGEARRALLHFDLGAAGVPATSMVDSVHLTLQMSRTVSSASAVAIHRVAASWGEGASRAGVGEGMGAPAETGDATWTHRFFGGERWATPGGSFEAAPSVTIQVNREGPYTWPSTPAIVADVQTWVMTPAQNHGWILIGDESAARSAKRFDSRNHSVEATRPSLTVYYRVP